MLKRHLDSHNVVDLPPSPKRARVEPKTPSRTQEVVFPPSSARPSFYNTPYAYSVPYDSPSNPLGMKRSLAALTLPKATSYGKHLALRFQLVSDLQKGKGKEKERDQELYKELVNVHRIVQVPTNYTFRHLHKLILYLFASDALCERPSTRIRAPSLQKHSLRSRGAKFSENNEVPRTLFDATAPDSWPGHTFEVREDVSLYRGKDKLGIIKPRTGRITARLSSVRERKLFSSLIERAVDEDLFAAPSTSTSTSSVPGFETEDEDDEKPSWCWEAEDDYTIRRVWPKGPHLDRGIVYNHLPGVSVHITVNTTRVPPRKGVGNQPHVFSWRGSARGAIRIAHLPSPGGENAHPPPTDAVYFDDESDSQEARLRKWNTSGAFQCFLKREAQRERALRRRPSFSPSISATPLRSRNAEGVEDTRAETPSSPPALSLALTSSSAPSSPATARLPQLSSVSSARFSSASTSSALSSVEFASQEFARLPLVTPAPAHPVQARRVAKASRRMKRLSREGLKDISGSEDEVDGDELFKEERGESREERDREGEIQGESDELYKEEQADPFQEEDGDKEREVSPWDDPGGLSWYERLMTLGRRRDYYPYEEEV